MEPDRWQRLQEVFEDALEQEATARPAFVRARCGGDKQLVAQVEKMLAAHESNGGFMSSPAFAGAEAEGKEVPAGAFGYRILRTLGSGGMGVVHLAEQLATGRTVALKVVGPWAASESLLRRFEFEVRALARLQHPAIAQMYEAGSLPEAEGRRPFFAMEYVEGKPLMAHLAQQQLDTSAKLALFLKICAGVQHAHQKGVIHRDLKPANILVTQSGEPKILDFGVATMIGEDAALTSLHTREGQLVGTLAYMSPEQVSGEKAGTDTRSDVYSLGVILHEMLTGQPPYDIARKSLVEAGRIIREEDPTRLSFFDRSFRGDLDVIVTKCLEKDRGRRYGSAEELSADLRRYLNDEPIVARPASTWYQMGKFARRNRVVVAAVAAVMLALVLGIAGTAWQALRATRAWNDLLLSRSHEREQLAEIVAGQEATRQQAAAADAVVNFIYRILSAPQPDLHGYDVKVTDVLRDASARADEELKDLPSAWFKLRRALAESYISQGSYSEAESECNLVIARAAKEPGNEAYADQARESLGIVRAGQGRFDESVAIYRELQPRTIPTEGPVSRESARALINLALAYHRSHHTVEAEPVIEQALQLVQRVQGPRDYLVVQAMVTHGAILLDLGKNVQAGKVLAAGAALGKQVLGPKDPMYLAALEAWANVEIKSGDSNAAVAAYEEVLKGQQEIYGGRNPFTLRAMSNLANALRAQRRYDESEQLFKETLKVRREVQGPEHPETLYTQNNYATLLSARGRHEEAAQMGRETLELRRKVLGPDDPSTLSTQHNLAMTLSDLKKTDEAITLLTQTIEARTRVLGASHHDTLWSCMVLGQMLHRAGRIAEGEQQLRSVIKSAIVAYPEEDSMVVAMRCYHVRCLYDLKQFEEAQDELQALRTRLTNSVGQSDSRLTMVNKNLVALYVAWGKPEEADRYRPPSRPAPAASNK